VKKQKCSHCEYLAVDYDVLLQPWCDACKMRKWLVNWGAQHRWLHLYETRSPSKEHWMEFVFYASDAEVRRLWLRIAIFERNFPQSFLGTEHNRISLPPPDRETRYEHRVFRNEWDAKWACFFSYLNIAYRYVREDDYGSDALPATTSFWLPELFCYQQHLDMPADRNGESRLVWRCRQAGAYCVVTGPNPGMREPERRERMRHFAMKTKRIVYLLEGRIGLPTHWDSYIISCFDATGENRRPFIWHECMSCHAIGVFHQFFSEYRFCTCETPAYLGQNSRLVQAYLSARYSHFKDAERLMASSTRWSRV